MSDMEKVEVQMQYKMKMKNALSFMDYKNVIVKKVKERYELKCNNTTRT